MIKVTDTHAHYDDAAFDGDRESLLRRLFSETSEKIITVGCSAERWRPTLELTDKFENMYGALGVHPEDICGLPEDYPDILKELASNKKIAAIGEAGLDYHYENFDRDMQITVFRRQLNLANELHMPIIIHSRDATEDTLDILNEIKPERAVMHCFSGSAETARRLVDMGFYISFTGVITFKNARKAISACEAVPADRLMLETDCPYMAPVPFRGARCDSSMILSTAAKMAEIKGADTEEMINICNKNAEIFFEI